ncbi:hypothetical protein PACTADRAFT_48619 [Pachysolen tannophilus NRRL Y-2460]|uniref:Uncharacterized protein n=1 Tax=Pachysolen tannophilus NRRL Y-2460 TaxID=669874 RepID=A0A1E4TYI3_PACTA|nr:hypothetical protein PACTADRAFT_48619 [Pachysolen tannophilus NRRL Y-2460]
MVLHNSKWDKKAKKNYERKHGISNSSKLTDDIDKNRINTAEKAHFVQNRYDAESSAEEEEKEGVSSDSGDDKSNKSDKSDKSDEFEESEESSTDTRGPRQKVLQSNDWRYRELPKEDDFMDLDLTNLKIKEFKTVKQLKDVNKLSASDLKNLRIGGNQDNNNDKKSHVFYLDDAKSKEEFYDLEKKAERMKIYREIKEKFGQEPNKNNTRNININNSENATKVLDLRSNNDISNALDKKLHKIQKETYRADQDKYQNHDNNNNFDADLNELLGLSHNSNHETVKDKSSNTETNIDDFLHSLKTNTTPTEPPKPSSEQQHKSKPHSIEPNHSNHSNSKTEDEDFLDSLLKL